MSKLTGRARYRHGWRGKLILQVEYETPFLRPERHQQPELGEFECRWRDAQIQDLVTFGGPLSIHMHYSHDEAAS